jgi:hypothetical protein
MSEDGEQRKTPVRHSIMRWGRTGVSLDPDYLMLPTV